MVAVHMMFTTLSVDHECDVLLLLGAAASRVLR